MADLLLGIQHCATAEEYREKMAEIVETGRCHLNLKEVCACVCAVCYDVDFAGREMNHARKTVQNQQL